MDIRESREKCYSVLTVFLTFAPMIVANMNLHEVYADLMGEMSKLDWKCDALLRKAVNVLRRSEEFPASVMYNY